MSSGEPPGGPTADELQPVSVPMTRIVEIGMGLWAVALVVVLVVPNLHEGSRFWWPWCCVAGIVLGLIGYAYLRRGRGNAAEATGT
jgi:Protein of unknown function (DUF2530)